MVSEDNNNNIVGDDDSGAYQTRQPLTFDRVWQMFQETERLIQQQSREAEKRFKETERIVRDVSKNIGGLNNNIGVVAEDYFRGAFSKLDELSGVKVKAVDSLHRRVGDVRGQFDAVVFGDTANILVEVKHKLREKDVIRFCEKTLPSFRQLYPEHCKTKIFGAVAGMTIDDDALSYALEQGLLVFTQSGQKIRQLNPKGFEPKEL